MEELDERSSAAYGAKTLGELRALTADLPAEPSAEPPRGWSPATVGWIAAGALLAVAFVVSVVFRGHVVFGWLPPLIALIIMRSVRGRRGAARSVRPQPVRRTGRDRTVS